MALPIPPGITVEMAKGFSLYMLEAIIGGCGDDLVDLARTNLWQQRPCRLDQSSIER